MKDTEIGTWQVLETGLMPISEARQIVESGDMELMAAEYAERLIRIEMRKGPKHASPILAAEMDAIENAAKEIDPEEFEWLVGRHMIGVWR